MSFAADIRPGRARQVVRKDYDENGECVVLAACDQCGRRAPQLHLVGRRVFCAHCCPACALRARKY
jgi:hypothetical protein